MAASAAVFDLRSLISWAGPCARPGSAWTGPTGKLVAGSRPLASLRTTWPSANFVWCLSPRGLTVSDLSFALRGPLGGPSLVNPSRLIRIRRAAPCFAASTTLDRTERVPSSGSDSIGGLSRFGLTRPDPSLVRSSRLVPPYKLCRAAPRFTAPTSPVRTERVPSSESGSFGGHSARLGRVSRSFLVRPCEQRAPSGRPSPITPGRLVQFRRATPRLAAQAMVDRFGLVPSSESDPGDGPARPVPARPVPVLRLAARGVSSGGPGARE